MMSAPAVPVRVSLPEVPTTWFRESALKPGHVRPTVTGTAVQVSVAVPDGSLASRRRLKEGRDRAAADASAFERWARQGCQSGVAPARPSRRRFFST